MTVNEILKEKLKSVGDDVLRTYIAPDIPEKKLHNAAKIIAGGIDENEIVGFVDGTLLGSAKEGWYLQKLLSIIVVMPTALYR